MKAVISTTADDNYLFFLPIVSWCWNKLGVDVMCFSPRRLGQKEWLASSLAGGYHIGFKCPENKETTYAQCSRLFAASPNLNIDRDEILIISDIDMAVFQIPRRTEDLCIYGADLVPVNQFPMCYASAPAWMWRKLMIIGDKTHQQCLDELLGDIECENMRGNYWSKDQQTLWERTHQFANTVNRARLGTSLASNRVDRDDQNWRSYLGLNLIDAHLWRPGYTDENFANIMELLQTQYPNDDLEWLKYYRQKYMELL